MLNNTINIFNSDFAADASGNMILADRTRMKGGYYENLGISYNAGTGTFTILSGNGTNLSSINPGYVNLPSKTAGLQKVIKITANQDFIDDNGSSEIVGNLFGLTTSIAVTVDMPFYIYAVLNDAENAVAFMLSRFPNTKTSPVAAKIGMPSSAVADTQGSFFSFDNITAADYESNPCLCVGSIRMRMSASDDWTVQTLSNYDGIGLFKRGYQFSAPQGQFGAASGKWFKDNGGTAPNDSSGVHYYFVDPETNRVYYELRFPAVTTSGVGSVACQLAGVFNSGITSAGGMGYIFSGSAFTFTSHTVTSSSNNIIARYVNPSTAGQLNNSNVVNPNGFAIKGNYPIEFS